MDNAKPSADGTGAIAGIAKQHTEIDVCPGETPLQETDRFDGHFHKVMAVDGKM